ncbi:hypothetical protein [Haloarcula litorea]|uniref:hypothetical protein n=1 Tax=Haloarcula litorea TaxID=3032579 RepID=UPI0023E83F43|nr:hypothetical protein [Halomicroarcula sp. GDY20]
MWPPVRADGGTDVEPTDRAALREHLERFAGTVTERADGTLRAEFGGRAHFAVDPDGRVDAGMPLHTVDAVADRLTFDHEGGEVHVEGSSGLSYTFRRP